MFSITIRIFHFEQILSLDFVFKTNPNKRIFFYILLQFLCFFILFGYFGQKLTFGHQKSTNKKRRFYNWLQRGVLCNVNVPVIMDFIFDEIRCDYCGANLLYASCICLDPALKGTKFTYCKHRAC